jgi:uncharacterized membrane protein YbhN (UPF0104 family)
MPSADLEERAPGFSPLKLLASLVAGTLVFVLAALVLRIDPKVAARHAALVPGWALAGLCASAIALLGLQALRWHWVMGPLTGLRYSHALRAQMVGVLLNAILPARGGDLLRVQYLGRRTGRSRATLLGTEIVDRWLDMWGWVPSFLAVSAISSPPLWLIEVMGAFCGIIALWAVVMVLLTRSGRLAGEGRLARAVHRLQAGLAPFRSRRIWLLALLLAPLPWLFETVLVYFTARLFGIELTPIQAYAVLIAANLATVVPSPGAVGTVEAGGTAALAFFGFDHSRSIAFLFVYHFSQLVPGVIAGALVLGIEGERLFGPRSVAVPVPPAE